MKQFMLGLLYGFVLFVLAVVGLALWQEALGAAVLPARITRTEASPPVIEFQNTGQKPITGIAFARMAKPDDLVFSDFPDDPVGPGASRRLHVGWREDSAVTVAAVVFGDGTSEGKATDGFSNQDVVQEIFELRRGQAEEWAKWEKLANKTITEFLADADAVSIGENPNTYEGGRIVVLQSIRRHAAQIKQLRESGKGDQWIRDNDLKPWVAERATRAQHHQRKEVKEQ